MVKNKPMQYLILVIWLFMITFMGIYGNKGLLRVYNGYVVKNTLTNEIEFN